jgi:hypothetical protein
MRTLVLTMLVLALSGCASMYSAPAFIVVLTGRSAGDTGRCTGAMLDANHILTAGHCSTLDRVVTQDGQEARIRADVFIASLDVAVMEADRLLYTGEVLEVGKLNPYAPAYLYGACPHLDLDVARRLTFGTSEIDDAHFEGWTVVGKAGRSNYVCGGDSGAPVLQDGKVVGVLSAVWTDVFLAAQGNETSVVPLDSIVTAIELSTMEVK